MKWGLFEVFWGHAILLFEASREVSGIGKANHVCHLVHRVIGRSQQFGSPLKSMIADEISGTLSCQATHLAVEVGPAHAHVATERTNAIALIVDVFVDVLRDALKELLLRR